MSRALEYDNSLTSVFGIMPKHCDDFARSTKLGLCVDQLDANVRTVLYHRNGAEEHHVTRDDDNRVVAIFTRNLKTGVART